MIRFSYIILGYLLVINTLIVSGSQTSIDGTTYAQAKTSLADLKYYIFRPETMYPVSSNARQLTPGFELSFSKDSIFCYLPYFGRVYTMAYAAREGVLDFTTTDFDFIAGEPKTKEQTITLRPKEHREIREMNITLYPDGYAYVQVIFNQRQNIAYRGQLVIAESP